MKFDVPGITHTEKNTVKAETEGKSVVGKFRSVSRVLPEAHRDLTGDSFVVTTDSPRNLPQKVVWPGRGALQQHLELWEHFPVIVNPLTLTRHDSLEEPVELKLDNPSQNRITVNGRQCASRIVRLSLSPEVWPLLTSSALLVIVITELVTHALPILLVL